MSNTLAAALAGLMAASFLGFATYLLLRRLRPEKRTNDLRSVAKGLRTPEQIDEYHLVRRIHDGQNSRVWEVYDEVSEEFASVTGELMVGRKPSMSE